MSYVLYIIIMIESLLMGWQVLSIINIFRCRSNKHPKRTQTHNCKGDGAVKSTSVSFAVSDGSIQP